MSMCSTPTHEYPGSVADAVLDRDPVTRAAADSPASETAAREVLHTIMDGAFKRLDVSLQCPLASGGPRSRSVLAQSRRE